MKNVREMHERAIYVDLEWTCWDGHPPAGRVREIIEIGAVEVNLNSLEIVREASYLVRPRHLDISSRCTRITGILATDLKSARAFQEVLNAFVTEFSPSEKLCCTWGRDDNDVLTEACRTHGLRSPMRNVIDLSHLFWRLFLLRQQASLTSALSMLGLHFDGVAHTALADARNAARIHAEIIRRMRLGPKLPSEIHAEPTNSPRSTLLGEKLRQVLWTVDSSRNLDRLAIPFKTIRSHTRFRAHKTRKEPSHVNSITYPQTASYEA
ncbi:exonuclease domain-containing protein [Alloacidobacterium dinghuense]|uniref:Exonuclease domain-containing protein n=1 Tax=Alloacidobacterium dinghuense TaxID=2763107 RepID=A0A7G8BHR7_9BACT|nr:3'-5' exonuclease [Alloacidobacterium dinghuense]QNI32087.1 exonuclease domain-containing protein [Alloacidobacterium dinghuense]